MKHYILAKFQDNIDWRSLIPQIEEVFSGVLAVSGITEVRVKPCCVDRANRYHLMIEITMSPEALAAYDVCGAHKAWKERYTSVLAAKAIFDSED